MASCADKLVRHGMSINPEERDGLNCSLQHDEINVWRSTMIIGIQWGWERSMGWGRGDRGRLLFIILSSTSANDLSRTPLHLDIIGN